MTKKISNFLIPIIVLTIFLTPLFIQAQGGNPQTGGGNPPAPIIIQNPFRESTIQGLISTIVNSILIPIGGVIAVLMIIYAGFLYVTARGNPAQIQKAHQALLWAVIGAAILLGAWVISQAIETTIDQLRG